MSNEERDELAETLRTHVTEEGIDLINEGPDWHIHDAAQYARELASVILAAGYSRPCTVTTVEELDALPMGSVVLSDDYRHYIDGWQVSFQRWSDGLWHRGARPSDTHPDNFLPATVLHSPAASK